MTTETVRDSAAGSTRRTLFLAAAVFLSVFLVYIASWQSQRTDSVFVMHSAMSLVRDGDLDISEFRSVQEWPFDFFEQAGGGTYMEYPAAIAVLAAPFALAVDVVTGGRLARELDAGAFSTLINATDMAIASFYTALAAVFIFFVCRRFLDERYALAGTLVFAFCTAAWSTASRGLWMHGPSMLLLAIALYLALLARERPSLAQFMGIPLAAAYIIRPTNILPAIFLVAWMAVSYRAWFWRCLAWGAATLLPFLLFNWFIYGAPLDLYHYGGSSRLELDTGTLAALAGQLVSPGRGLLVYSPILILAPYGIYLKMRRKQIEALDLFLLATVIAHWLLISTFDQWWGGSSYGPRLFTDMLPFLVYFLIPVLARLQQDGLRQRWALAGLAVVLLLVSVAINMQGATRKEPILWNIEPVHVDVEPSRVWDWSDPPFLRGLRD